MWTLTVDRQMFNSPEEALRYVRERKLISEWVRSLKRRGYLHTSHWFYVLEFQMENGDGWPHWHVALNTGFIPFDVAAAAWNRFRPSSAETVPAGVQGHRPGFGSIRYSKGEFESPDHAAHYLTKYLIKHPERGYPDWALDFAGKLRRCDHSRHLWREHGITDDRAPDRELTPWEELEQRFAKLDQEEEEPEERAAADSTRRRVANCGNKSVLLRIDEITLADGELTEKVQYLGTVIWTSSLLKRMLGLPDDATRHVLQDHELSFVQRQTTAAPIETGPPPPEPDHWRPPPVQKLFAWEHSHG